VRVIVHPNFETPKSWLGNDVPKDKLIVHSENELQKIQERLDAVRVDLGASGAMLQDQAGRLLVECGSHGDIDVDAFLALLSNAMSASGAVMQLLRDVSAFDLHVHEGTQYEIYSTRIDDQVFLTLLFAKKESAGRVGMVWVTLRRAVPELRSLLNRAVAKSGPNEDKEIKDAISATWSESPKLSEGDVSQKNLPSSASRAKEPRKKSPPSDPAASDANEANRTISYDEAHRLGYVNLDNHDSKK